MRKKKKHSTKVGSEWAEAAQCRGKDAFDTFELANSVARRKTKHGLGLRAYKCPFCKGFHIGGPGGLRRK